VLGRAAILAQDPHDHPERPKKSPAPLVHAASKAVRLEFREAYALFVAAYREAAPVRGLPWVVVSMRDSERIQAQTQQPKVTDQDRSHPPPEDARQDAT
jgi:hypothetical protein